MVKNQAPRKVVGVLAVVVATVALLAGCLSQGQTTAQNLVNADRAANGKAALVDYNTADVKAQAWAEHLAANGVGVRGDLVHSNLTDGYAGVSWCRLGENIGMGGSVEAIEPSFMASQHHRDNILGDYNNIGTGVATNATTGYTYVVQEFVKLC